MSDKDCRDIHRVLVAGRDAKSAVDDERGFRTFSLLAAVASYHPNYDDRTAPYKPMISLADGRRSDSPEDLTDNDLNALRGYVEDIPFADFRARIADVLWVTRRDHQAALIAIRAFLEFAESIKSAQKWVNYSERLERAAQLACIGGLGKEKERVVAAIEAGVAEFNGNLEAGRLCASLMSVLCRMKAGDPACYAAVSEKMASSFSGKGDWLVSQEYWEMAAKWHRCAKDEAARARCQLAAAECIVAQGEAMLSSHGAGSAAYWFSRALVALRRAKASPDRVREIHTVLLGLQKQSLGEMKRVEWSFGDDPDSQKRLMEGQQRAHDLVSGVALFEAIQRFAQITQPAPVEVLEKSYTEATKGAIYTKLFGSTVVDRDGKVAACLPPEPIGTTEPATTRMRRLYRHATQFVWPIQVVQFIEPARLAIVGEHSVRTRDLEFLVHDNPFVQPGHEGQYLRGIQAGFHGDWLVALSILVPSLESSVRTVLRQHGVVTSGLDEDGDQSERDLCWLLNHHVAETVFGLDVLFDLRGILVERFGHNLRNEMAHGLLPEGGFYRPVSEYLWWLVVRLLWIGTSAVQASLSSSPSQDPASSHATANSPG